MTAVKVKIRENDVVDLREPIERWPAGTMGAVVAERGDWKLIEIADAQGVALDFIAVPESHLNLVSKHSR